MLIGDVLNAYLEHHLAGKPSAPYYGRLIRQVFPPLAAFPIDDVPKLELLRWWTSLADRPGHANKSLGLLRAAFKWAVGVGLVPLLTPNPSAGIAKRPERTRATTTSPEEWARIVPLLEDLPLRRRGAYWQLYLTGSRPGEVRMTRTEDLFLERDVPVWVKPSTKNGRPHIVPLPDQLVPILRLVVQTNPKDARWLYWGESPDVVWGRTSMQKMWEGIREKAGLSHLWLNDLRRSTASDLLNQGENLGVVQSQLNHRSLSQTAKYAWLRVRPLAEALQKRTDVILSKLPS